MGKKIALVIGRVWPEPKSSAAGSRILQLVSAFQEGGYKLHFASAAEPSPFSQPLEDLNVSSHAIRLNHSSFDAFLHDLQPELVLYDRFVSQEQFGWRVKRALPQAVQVLDTEDLHFLREARRRAYHDKTALDFSDSLVLRELAAIYRCDLSLMISPYEMGLLKERFQVPENLLYELPFMENLEGFAEKLLPSFHERQDMCFIGNFIHAPNWATVLALKKTYWPLIRRHLPEAKLHIYGAYPSEKVFQLHNEKEGFLIKGRAEDALEVIGKTRLILAPLAYGAGQKGKFIDAMKVGTVIATNGIGKEGMFEDSMPGFAEDEPVLFAREVVRYYEDEALWTKASQKGLGILEQRFHRQRLLPGFLRRLGELSEGLLAHRERNVIGRMLELKAFSAERYMSQWIEEKEKKC